jgi:hypothetical protein
MESEKKPSRVNVIRRDWSRCPDILSIHSGGTSFRGGGSDRGDVSRATLWLVPQNNQIILDIAFTGKRG